MNTNPTHITAPAGTPFIEVVREFDAPGELVYRASTGPDLVAQWLFGSGVRFFGDYAGSPVLLDNPQVVQGDRVTHLHYRVSSRG